MCLFIRTGIKTNARWKNYLKTTGGVLLLGRLFYRNLSLRWQYFVFSFCNLGEIRHRDFLLLYRWRKVVQREMVSIRTSSWWPGKWAGECSPPHWAETWVGGRVNLLREGTGVSCLHSPHLPSTFHWFNSVRTVLFLSLSSWRPCNRILTESVAFSLHPSSL